MDDVTGVWGGTEEERFADLIRRLALTAGSSIRRSGRSLRLPPSRVSMSAAASLSKCRGTSLPPKSRFRGKVMSLPKPSSSSSSSNSILRRTVGSPADQRRNRRHVTSDGDGVVEDESEEEVVDVSRADWSDMVHEALVHAFRFLAVQDRFNVGLVCKAWHRASLDPCCWTDAILDDILHDDEILHDDDRLHYSLACQGSNMELVRSVMARSKGKLTKLSVVNCPGDCLELIGRECPLLEDLRFANTEIVPSFPPVETFVEGCRMLRTLDLRNTRVEGFSIGHVVETVAPGSRQLLSLMLDGTTFGDEEVEIVTDNLSRLELLGLGGGEITDMSLELIGKKLTRLRVLRVDRCRSITVEGVEVLRAERKDVEVSAVDIGRGGGDGGRVLGDEEDEDANEEEDDEGDDDDEEEEEEDDVYSSETERHDFVHYYPNPSFHADYFLPNDEIDEEEIFFV